MSQHHVHFNSEPAGTVVFEALKDRATWTIGEEPPKETSILVDGSSPQNIANIPLLQAVIVPWAGVGKATLLAANTRGLPVYSLHHNNVGTAEMALALLLACARKLSEIDPALRRGEWIRPEAIQLEGKTAVIYGYGAIGRHVGRVCQALGLAVIGVRRTSKAEAGDIRIVGQERLSEVLSEAHALIVTAPQTPETEGRIGAAEMRLLRSPSLLVNVGRGNVVRETDLHEALRDGVLHAAGVDVWYRYPKGEASQLPSDLPFHELPNLVMTPHCGGATDQAEPLRAKALAHLLDRILAGDPPPPVDPTAGY